MVQKLVEVRESHEVAESVRDDWGRDVAGSDEEERRVHPENGRVRTLQEGQA